MKCIACGARTRVKRVYPEFANIKERQHECTKCGSLFLSYQTTHVNRAQIMQIATKK